MKKISLAIVALVACIVASAQTDSLLKWQTEAKKTGDGSYELVARATIPAGWHVYGNNPTQEGLDAVKFIPAYENAKLSGEIVFDKTPASITDPIFENKKLYVFTGTIEIRQQVKITGFIPATLKGSITANLGKGKDQFSPSEFPFEVTLEGGAAASNTNAQIKLASVDINKPLQDCGKKNNVAGNGLWSIFLLGFLGGLIALLTPCVFPMIPVTVSFFTKRAANRKQAIKNGALYGFFIFLIYLLASVPFHVLGNVRPEIF